jgi:chromosome segregation ATPase
MATPLDTPHHDIDRTDELPQLDVAAYEASLASNPTIVRASLDRTQLRPPRPEADPTIVRTPGAAAARHDGARDEQSKIIAGLKADNARLSELRSIGEEMVKRLEQKLRDQSVQFTAQLTELQSSRFDERIEGERTREELQQQIAQKAVQLAALQENQAKLSEELQAATQRADENAEKIHELKALLVDEETGAEQLALQLASKLRDCDALTALVASRNQVIEELKSRVDDDDGQQQTAELRAALQAAENNGTTLQRELAAARSVLGDEQNRRHAVEEQLRAEGLNAEGLRAGLDFARAQLQELSNERDSLLSLRGEAAEKSAALERAEELLSEAQGDIATLHSELGAQVDKARVRDAELAAAQAAVSELRRERDVLQQGLEQAWQASEAMQAEIHTHLQMLQAKTAELAAARQELDRHGPALSDLEQALRARDEVSNHLRQQLQNSQDEHVIVSGQLQKVRLRVRSLADQIFQRDNQIAALKAELATHADALAAIRRDVDRIDENSPGETRTEAQRMLMPMEHEGEPIVLDRPVLCIGRTPDNDVCIPSKLISRRHARLLISANGVVVEDAGSTNGCYVNGIEVTQRLLQEGDVLELGDLRFRLCSPAASTQARDNVIEFSGQKT